MATSQGNGITSSGGTTNKAEKPWYWIPSSELEIPSETRELFEKYSGIPEGEVVEHVIDVRDKAWSLIPYPCIGGFRFLTLSVQPSNLFFDLIMDKLRDDKDAEFLDVGCCFGQDVRAACFYSGREQTRFHGLDVRRDLVECGYDLFKDRDSFGGTFHVCDLLGGEMVEDVDIGAEIKGKITVLHAALFLHLFTYDEQLLVLKRFIKLLLADKPGVMITGRQLGNWKPGEYRSKVNPGKMRYLHNADSFTKLWREVGESTGTEWDVSVSISDVGEYSGSGNQENEEDGAVYMIFCVERVWFDVSNRER